MIIFISDMYLPKFAIKRALEKNGIACEDNELFVSSEFKVTKHTGNLYKKVLHELKTEPGNLIHTGDNSTSDFLVPQSLGIEAIHFSKFTLGKRENLILNHKKLPHNFKSILTACIRLTTVINNHAYKFHDFQYS